MNVSLRQRALGVGIDILGRLQADRWLAPVADWRGVVLMLHRVRPASSDAFQPNRHLEIAPAFLDFVLTRLAERAIPVVDLDEAIRRLAAGQGRFAVLTFDDGYRDNLEIAFPVMARHRVPFTIFVATGLIDGTALPWWLVLEETLRRRDRIDLDLPDQRLGLAADGPAAKRRAFDVAARRLRALPEAARRPVVRGLAAAAGIDIPAMLAAEMMTWDELRRLAADPLATIGGHTVDHPSLASLSDAAAKAEIVGGLDRLEAQLGRRPSHFAYPFGSARDVSARDIALVRQLGLASAVTTRPGMLHDPGQRIGAWPRLSLNGHFQTARAFDVLLSGVPFLPGRFARGPRAGD